MNNLNTIQSRLILAYLLIFVRIFVIILFNSIYYQLNSAFYITFPFRII